MKYEKYTRWIWNHKFGIETVYKMLKTFFIFFFFFKESGGHNIIGAEFVFKEYSPPQFLL